MKTNRGSFTNRIGFVLAAAGSAVGLGNIWRFPYLAAKYGGGIFLLVYVVLAVTFGYALMITEISIGRKTSLSCIGAYEKLNSRFGFLSWLATLVPVIITPYYCVIGGWVIKYLVEFAMGHMSATVADDFFTGFITASQSGLLGSPVLWFAIFLLLTAVVVLAGVDKGIEKASRLMMPILVVLALGIAIYSLTLPGAIEGLKYYILPDFSKFSGTTVLAAMGQMFYSLSLAMGIMVTYGSYMKKEDDLEKSVTQIEIFDTLIAFIAGLMIIPAVFAFSGGADLNAGPGLMFVTLPKVFNSFAGGGIMGTVFFLLVIFAALTSSISLMETVVSIVQDKLHWNRKTSTVAVAIGIFLIGLLSCLGYGPLSGITIVGMAFLDFFDFISNSVLMPIVAFITCILIGHVVGTGVIEDEVERTGDFKRKGLFRIMIRWIAPVLVVIILAGEILKVLGVITV